MTDSDNVIKKGMTGHSLSVLDKDTGERKLSFVDPMMPKKYGAHMWVLTKVDTHLNKEEVRLLSNFLINWLREND